MSLKWLITDTNVKHDFTFQDALYFRTTLERDNYILSLFDETYPTLADLFDTSKDVKSGDLNEDEGKITIETTLSLKKLRSKNYMVISDCEDIYFYFIMKVRPVKGESNKYVVRLQRDIIMEKPGFLAQLGDLEILEGHVNDKSLLDLNFDAGYKTIQSLKPLERKASEQFFNNYPYADIKMLDNQWIYLFITSSNDGSTVGNKLFKLNDQALPYRILIAPLKEIIINNEDREKVPLATINRSFVALHGTWDLSDQTNYESGFQPIPSGADADILRKTTYKFENNLDVLLGGVNIKYTSTTASIAVPTSDDQEQTLLIPYDVFTTLYKDREELLFIGDEEHRNYYNNLLWTNQVPTANDKPQFIYNKKLINTAFVTLKWDSINNEITISGAVNGGEENNQFLEHVYFAGVSGRDYKVFSPGPYGITYENRAGARNIAGGEGDNDWSTGNWEYLPDSGAPLAWGFKNYQGDKNTTINIEKLEWAITIKEAYQGAEGGGTTFVWNSDSLVEFINKQSQAIESSTEQIIAGKISSYNPITINPITSFPKNVYPKDSITPPSVDSWDNDAVYELFELNLEESADFNTYSLENYLDKSWLSGINNYSVMIENNKEFNLKPELVYGEKEFIHQVIPTPNEWVERIVWGNDIHNEGYEFSNKKEFLFATNAFNIYQQNERNTLDNEQAKINSERQKNALNVGLGALTAVTSGGTSLIPTALILSGGNGAISTRQAQKDLQANIANLKEQPVVSTGTGSAYADLYLNKNAFGLSIAEWVYTTPQASSVIERVIRKGITADKPIYAKWKNISRPEFNHLKLANAMEALSRLPWTFDDKAYLANILTIGTTFWFKPGNILDYTVDNGSYFTRKMINYYNFNGGPVPTKEKNED